MALNLDDLANYISEYGIDAEFIFLEHETPTVEAAAKAVGVDPENIGKSILFLAAGELLLVVANGASRLSYRPIAQHLGLSRRQLKLATGKEVLAYSGYSVGAVPPFGHPAPLPTLISATVLELEILYVGGGSDNTLLKIKPQELVRATNGEIIVLTGS